MPAGEHAEASLARMVRSTCSRSLTSRSTRGGNITHSCLSRPNSPSRRRMNQGSCDLSRLAGNGLNKRVPWRQPAESRRPHPQIPPFWTGM